MVVLVKCMLRGSVYVKHAKTAWNRFATQVSINKGMREGQSIVYREEGHQLPDGKIGHLIFVIKEVEHSIFMNVDYNHLALKVQITIEKAFFGLTKYIETLNGRWIEAHPDISDV